MPRKKKPGSLYTLRFQPSGHKRPALGDPPDIKPRNSTSEGDPDPVKEMADYLGNTSDAWQIARRVMKDIYPHHPSASTPELVTYDYLAQHGKNFRFQVQLSGGRAFEGGLLPDFVVFDGGKCMVWQIQGEYWHSRRVNQGRDRMVNQLLLGMEVEGIKIDTVIELWEQDIRTKRPKVYDLALAGVGLRG